MHTSQGGWCDLNHNSVDVWKQKSSENGISFVHYLTHKKKKKEIYIGQLQYWFSWLFFFFNI